MVITVSQGLVPVYRMCQPISFSACLLGTLCPTCARHRRCVAGHACRDCRRGKPYECERERPAPPAFMVKVREAMRLVEERLASFVHKNTALRLNYPQITNLRDMSAKADERVIYLYVSGSYIARVAIDWGWAMPPDIVAMMEPKSFAQLPATYWMYLT